MKAAFILVVVILGSGTAHADSDAPVTFYAGVGVTHDTVNGFAPLSANPENTRLYPDVSATSWKALAGIQTSDWFAVEVDHIATASTSGPVNCCSGRSEFRATAGYAVFLTRFERWPSVEPFFKAGLEGYTLTAAGTGESDSGASAALGAGLQWHYEHVGARVEYEFFPGMGHTSGAKIASLSLFVSI